MRITLLLVGGILIGGRLCAATSEENRSSLPEGRLSDVVSISLRIGENEKFGSGVYLNSTNGIFLVTARHILFKRGSTNSDASALITASATLTSYDKSFADAGKNVLVLDLPALVAQRSLICDVTNDLCVVWIGKIKVVEGVEQRRATLIKGVKANAVAPGGVIGCDLKATAPLKDVVIGNDAYIFGYPKSVGLKSSPSINHDKPLVRKGVVAGTNTDSKRIIVDCPTYGGNSGGPVVQVIDQALTKKFELIGIIVEFVPFQESWLNEQFNYRQLYLSNSGLSVVVPMDPIYELINRVSQAE